MESSLDIDAVYRTKASLSTLISDTTSVANRRTVDCGISIKDKLSNPQLSFSHTLAIVRHGAHSRGGALVYGVRERRGGRVRLSLYAL